MSLVSSSRSILRGGRLSIGDYKRPMVGLQRRAEAMLENITLIAYLCLEFHVSLNSRNTKLANGGDHWGSLDI